MFTLELPRHLQTVLSIDHNVAAFCGITLNLVIVIGLCLKRSAVLGNYRWFLIAHTVNDLVSAVTGELSEMCFDYTSSTFVILINGPVAYLGKIITITIFAIFVICNKNYLVILSKTSSKILIALVILVPVALHDVLVSLDFTYNAHVKVQIGKSEWDVVTLHTESQASPLINSKSLKEYSD
ncbi:hypothetical protein L596_020462 [Steinernema carpocapsae]|uniref:Uncharacterized protein n=1 Tax=Steinernema carpocapsae TaxID=34508 RepID=A0A4U5MTL8_STECR|nr:hypothetical protein L596_020462 [Steinernema carpocapsae]